VHQIPPSTAHALNHLALCAPSRRYGLSAPLRPYPASQPPAIPRPRPRLASKRPRPNPRQALRTALLCQYPHSRRLGARDAPSSRTSCEPAGAALLSIGDPRALSPPPLCAAEPHPTNASRPSRPSGPAPTSLDGLCCDSNTSAKILHPLRAARCSPLTTCLAVCALPFHLVCCNLSRPAYRCLPPPHN
jgi:hypothetical protein